MNKKRIFIYAIFFIMIFILVGGVKNTISDIRLYLIVLMVLAVVLYFEKIDHKRRISEWEKIREKGKLRFILLEYVLFRGCSVSVFILLLLTLKLRLTLWLVCPFIPLLGVCAYAGKEIWNHCEENYSVTRMKSLAEKMKILQN